MSLVAFLGLKALSKILDIHALAQRYVAEINNFASLPTPSVYSTETLHLRLNRIYDLPDVKVDPRRPRTINVLVPAFAFQSMSAGFFGVFQVARFLKACGYNVRCVFFDNFYYNEAEFREKLLEYPGLEALFDEIEMDYIGERKQPLLVSAADMCVATVWYSAHFANKIMNSLGGRPFIYLIQDYEASFFAGSSLSTQAENSYELNYHALYSTKSLMDFCVSRGIDKSAKNGNARQYFNNACSANLVTREQFMRVNGSKAKRDFVYYARPGVSRNMFELAALSLGEACKQGVFSPEGWNFWSVGLGEVQVQLGNGIEILQLPRMTLKQYADNIGNFDLGLSLMASPHPSLLPMDLAGSGCICVTNTYATKTSDFFAEICDNIIASPPNLDDLVSALSLGVQRSEAVKTRYEAAAAMKYPRNWSESFDDSHIAFVRRVMEG